METLDRAGRVEQATDLRRKAEDRRNMRPVPPPERDDHGILLAPRPRRERVERGVMPSEGDDADLSLHAAKYPLLPPLSAAISKPIPRAATINRES